MVAVSGPARVRLISLVLVLDWILQGQTADNMDNIDTGAGADNMEVLFKISLVRLYWVDPRGGTSRGH